LHVVLDKQRRLRRAGRKTVDWEDTIKAETVILSRFSLGKDNRLAKETVKLF